MITTRKHPGMGAWVDYGQGVLIDEATGNVYNTGTGEIYTSGAPVQTPTPESITAAFTKQQETIKALQAKAAAGLGINLPGGAAVWLAGGAALVLVVLMMGGRR